MIVPPFGKYPSLELQPWMYNEQYTFVRYVFAFYAQERAKLEQTTVPALPRAGRGGLRNHTVEWVLPAVAEATHTNMPRTAVNKG